jgi:hypothetical protein
MIPGSWGKNPLTLRQRRLFSPNADGGFIDPDNNPKSPLHKIARDLKLPKLTFRVIWGTIATLARKKGTVKDVQGLRHSCAATNHRCAHAGNSRECSRDRRGCQQGTQKEAEAGSVEQKSCEFAPKCAQTEKGEGLVEKMVDLVGIEPTTFPASRDASSALQLRACISS